MFKRVLTIVTLLVVGLGLASCQKAIHEVTFESNGGLKVEAVKVTDNKTLTLPKEPTKEGYVFEGWFENEDLSGEAYDAKKPVKKSFKLYAKWLLDEQTAQYVRFIDHRQNTTSLVVADASGKVAKPTAPTRAGYRFGGWFKSKRGMTWNEAKEFDFNQVLPEGGLNLYAYWEPVNSQKHDWTDGETFFSTLSSTSTLVMNPLNYEYATDIDLIRQLSTQLYTQEVDWGRAIEEGIADYPGDFSKFGSGEGKYGIDLLKTHYILVGAAAYPKNRDGHDLVDPETGKWDADAASNFLDSQWVIEIRDDLVFEDGTPITAEDYIYTYKQYIDPIQVNKRGTAFFPTADRENGYRIVNARSYFTQTAEEGHYTGQGTDGNIPFEDVGFKKLDDYRIELTFEVPVGQTSAYSLMNNIYLVHKARYEASLDEARKNSNYGTKLNPYVSYGAYTIKSWDENQKLVFNKNYDYIFKHTVNYKSYSYQFTPDVDSNMELWKQGKLSAVGLIGEYASEYAEWANNYPTYRGYPVSLDINMTDSLDETRPANKIIRDKDFRKAIFFGFERQEFANTLFAPNTASIMIWPIEAKQYAADEFWYKDTAEHAEVLELLGINPETAGFDGAKALQHFNLAYDRWVAEGNSGAVQIDFVGYNDKLYISYANYIIQHFHQLFNVDGVERIKITYRPLDDKVLFATIDNRSFDFALDVGGWGHALRTNVFMALKGLYYTFLFGPDAGANHLEAVPGLKDAQVFKPIDLRNALKFLEDTKYERVGEEETPTGFWDETTSYGDTLALYNKLVENEGYYEGSSLELFLHLLNDEFIWGKDEEPYPGAVDDLTRITAAFEYIILDLVTLIPIGSRTSITAYAMNVVIEWPHYSYELGWGPGRYRYLNTDPDFAK